MLELNNMGRSPILCTNIMGRSPIITTLNIVHSTILVAQYIGPQAQY